MVIVERQECSQIARSSERNNLTMCRNKEETSQLTFKKPWPDHLTMAGPLFRQFNEIHYIYVEPNIFCGSPGFAVSQAL